MLIKTCYLLGWILVFVFFFGNLKINCRSLLMICFFPVCSTKITASYSAVALAVCTEQYVGKTQISMQHIDRLSRKTKYGVRFWYIDVYDSPLWFIKFYCVIEELDLLVTIGGSFLMFEKYVYYGKLRCRYYNELMDNGYVFYDCRWLSCCTL